MVLQVLYDEADKDLPFDINVRQFFVNFTEISWTYFVALNDIKKYFKPKLINI